MHRKSLASALTLGAAGLSSKAFLKVCCADVKVVGMQRLSDEIENIRIGQSKGLLTGRNCFKSFILCVFDLYNAVSNHISVLESYYSNRGLENF